MTDDRLMSGLKREQDALEATIRPQSLDEFIGQEQARANLKVFVQAAKARGDALDHVLFVGPPGLGKTTLSQIMAKELGVGFRATSGEESLFSLGFSGLFESCPLRSIFLCFPWKIAFSASLFGPLYAPCVLLACRLRRRFALPSLRARRISSHESRGKTGGERDRPAS